MYIRLPILKRLTIQRLNLEHRKYVHYAKTMNMENEIASLLKNSSLSSVHYLQARYVERSISNI